MHYNPLIYVGLVGLLVLNFTQPTSELTTTKASRHHSQVLATADFSLSETQICQDKTVTITYTGTAAQSATYDWDVDGGTILSGSGQGPLQVSWPTPGPKTITLDVDDSGTQFSNSESLIIDTVYSITVDTAICAGELFMLGNTKLTESGNYSETFTTVAGCDSTVNLNLTVNDPSLESISETICEGESFIFGTQTLTTTGDYTETFTNQFGCDSTVNLSLGVLPTKDTTLKASICEGAGLIFGGQTITTEGTYTDVKTAVNGCDSTITLEVDVIASTLNSISATRCGNDPYQLGNNFYDQSGLYSQQFTGSNGCDSTVLLSLTVLPYYEDTLNINLCTGESYTVGDSIYSETGIYRDTFMTVEGCDSIIHLDLEIFPHVSVTIDTTICAPNIFAVGDSVYNQTGNYLDTIQTTVGCDSIVTLNLTVNPYYSDTISMEICEGESFIVGTQSYDETGIYRDTFSTVEGCDSIIQLDLVVNPVYRDTLLEVLCAGDGKMIGDSLYTTSGIYRDTFNSIDACDSIIYLDLTILPEIKTNIDTALCMPGSIMVGDSVYTATGLYQDTLTAANGCDSIIMLDLTVFPRYVDTLNVSLCEGENITVGNILYSTSGMYLDTLSTVNGCDSIIHLNLTVNPVYREMFSRQICSGEQVMIGDSIYTATGMYQDTLQTINGCDSIIMLDLLVADTLRETIVATICTPDTMMVGTSKYFETGVYQDTLTAEGGCDSIVTLDLTVHPSYRDTLNEMICGGDSILVGNQSYKETGIYIDTLLTQEGCDSIIYLDLKVSPTYRDTTFETICQGDSVLFNGLFYAESGVYADTLVSSESCDSILVLDLDVSPMFLEIIDEEICAGTPYSFGGKIIDEPGVYLDTLQAENGCDSVIFQLNMNILDTFLVIIDSTICGNESVRVGAKTYNETGNYIDTLNTRFNCDSIIHLNLNVIPLDTTRIDTMICSGDTLRYGGFQYTLPGIYISQSIAESGCDSTIILNLSVPPVPLSTIDTMICPGASIQIGDRMIDQTGIFRDTVQTMDGCDSILLWRVSIDEMGTSLSNISETICEGASFLFGDSLLTQAGIYRDTFVKAASGCDSIVELSLSVFDQFESTNSLEICAGDSILFQGSFYKETGIYADTLQTVNGCDSILTLDLSVTPASMDTVKVIACEGDSYSFGGFTFTRDTSALFSFETTAGCDSTILFDLEFAEEIRVTTLATICTGETYQFYERTLSTEGTFLKTFETVNGCDSIIELQLEILPVNLVEMSAQICEGDSYIFRGDTLTMTGIYRDTISGITDCDTIIYLALTEAPSYSVSETISLCPNDTITFAGQTFTETGVFPINLATNFGCDSTILLNIQPAIAYNDTIPYALCQGDTLSFGDTLITRAGTYEQVFMSQEGCDSMVVLDLEIIPHPVTIVEEAICLGETYQLGDTLLQDAGNYTRIIPSINGCDSTVMLSLSVIDIDTEIAQIEICADDVYEFGEQILTESGNYMETFQTEEGCDSTVILILTVKPAYSSMSDEYLCTGDSLAFGDIFIKEPGIYTRTFQTSLGCDSIVQVNVSVEDSIRINLNETICAGETYIWNNDTLSTTGAYRNVFEASGGCDSIVTLNLEVIDSLVTDLTESICDGELYLFGNEILEIGGEYKQVLQSSAGCDSIVNLTLTVNPRKFRNRSEEICPGDTIMFGEQVIIEAGIYRNTYTSATGCDSIITLKVDEKPSINQIVDLQLCEGSSFAFAGQVLTESGIYEERYSDTEHTCDSVITLNLTFVDTIFCDIETTICQNSTYSFDGRTINTSGTYIAQDQSVNGCDSITRLSLTVVDRFEIFLEETICPNETYFFDNTNLNTSGTYQQSLVSSAGCDSIVTLSLTVAEPLETTIIDEFCDGELYFFGDRILTGPGNYSALYQGANGCDSVVTLQLSQQEPYVENLDVTICDGDSYIFNGDTLTMPGMYNTQLKSFAGCDSLIFLNLSIREPIPATFETVSLCDGASYVFGKDTLTESNIYTKTFQTEEGCDSTVTLVLELKDFGPAMINMDTVSCTEDATLRAVSRSGTTGRWSTTGGAVILTPSENISTAFELDQGKNTFIWTLSAPECPNYDADTVDVVFRNTMNEAIADQYTLALDQTTLMGNVVTNDIVEGDSSYIVTLIEDPSMGQVRMEEDGNFEFETEGSQFFNTSFIYLLTDLLCPTSSDTAIVEIGVDPNSLSTQDAFGITPNGDGVNEFFIIPELEAAAPDEFPDNELMIFNRWGDLVYSAKPYNNDWMGTNQDGEALKSGTYYFILKLNTILGLKKTGIVVILN